jgi:hypothetical protein
LLPAGQRADDRTDSERWAALAALLEDDARFIVVDAGTGTPPPALHRAAERRWLVTRACYLALRAAVAQATRPNGIVLVDEPGRSLRRDDVEAALGAPVVAEVLLDPAVARAVDAGLLISRLPLTFRRRLRAAA